MNFIDKDVLLQRINTQFWAEIENIINSAPSIDLADYVPKDFHDKTCEAMAKRHTEEIQKLMPKRGEWIPCSERLPSESGRYIVVYPLLIDEPWVSILWYGKPTFPEKDEPCFYASDDEYGDVEYSDVIAWMPLPEPYKEGEPQTDCNNCKHKGVEGCEQPCLGCNGCDLYEPKDEPQTERSE